MTRERLIKTCMANGYGLTMETGGTTRVIKLWAPPGKVCGATHTCIITSSWFSGPIAEQYEGVYEDALIPPAEFDAQLCGDDTREFMEELQANPAPPAGEVVLCWFK